MPILLRWQGCLQRADSGPLGRQLTLIAGLVLCALMAGLPLVTRSGLTLLITAAGLLWLLWALRTPPGRIGAISGWLLVMLGGVGTSAGYLLAAGAAAWLEPLFSWRDRIATEAGRG